MNKKKAFLIASGLITTTALVSTAGSVQYIHLLTQCKKLPYVPKRYLKRIGEEDMIKINEIAAKNQWLKEQKMEKIQIQSYDGLMLTGHYLPTENAKRTLILVHGWHGNWIHDFGYIAEFLHNEHNNLLLIDQRCHGESEGKYIGLGVLERYDVLAWADYMAKRLEGSMPLYLAGVSMGATSVMMASSLELPSEVKGIIADCGFTSPEAIVSCIMNAKRKLPGKFLIEAASALSKLKAGYRYNEYSTLDAVQNTHIPILFIHGTADRFVPMKMTLENFDACTSEKELLLAEGAGHGMSYFDNTEQYEKKLRAFFEKHDK